MDNARTIRIENDRCRLSFVATDAAPLCRVELHDKQTNLRLRSGLVELEAVWDALQRFEVLSDLKVARTEQFSAVSIGFDLFAQRSRIEFRLVITLDGAEWTATIPWAAIRENRQDHFRLFGIRPLPGLLRTSQ